MGDLRAARGADAPTIGSAAAKATQEGRRSQAILAWLTRRADTAYGRLGVRWWKAYFASSRNSACATTVYSALSVLPAALVATAVVHIPGSNATAFAERLVTHLRLSAETTKLVEATFGSAADNAVAATLAAAVGFLLWGIGIGQLYRDVYVRAWGLELATRRGDQVRYTVFFFVFTSTMALGIVSPTALHGLGWAATIAAWSVGSLAFWLWTPWYLLRRAVGLRALLPGAAAATLLLGGTVATSPLWLSPTMNQNGAAFGSFGVVLTLIAYLFILVTMTLACAVLSPVWAAWRRDERERDG